MTLFGAWLFIGIGLILLVWGFMLRRHSNRLSHKKHKKPNKYEYRAALAYGQAKGYEFGMKWRKKIIGLFRR